MPYAKQWERKNEEYLGEISSDDDLDDSAFIEVLEDLIDRAQSAVDAKKFEVGEDG